MQMQILPWSSRQPYYEQPHENRLGVEAMTEDTEEAVRSGSGTDANANSTVEFPPTLGERWLSRR